MNTTTVRWIGYAAAVLSVMGLLPQMARFIVRKEADDVSWYHVLFSTMKAFLWIYYSLILKIWPLLVSQVFLLVFFSVITYIKLVYDQPDRPYL
jgi:uncharacterized protein with PQ loop repeat